MGIESDILEAVETRLNTIATPTFNITPGLVTTRDENININTLDRLDDGGLLPAYLVRFGRQGLTNDQFVDMPRIGRVNQMLIVEVRAYMKDIGTGDTATALASKVMEDIFRAIADMRDDVAGVYRAIIRNPSFPFETWSTKFEVIDFPIEFWYSWEQRAIVAATPTGLIAPTSINFLVVGSAITAAGQLTLTYAFASPTTGVNVYRNGIKVVTLTTATTYNDPQWIADNFYQLGAEDVSANEVLTPIFQYPYYPTTTPLVNYYLPSWALGTQQLAEFQLGDSTPEMLIEHQIRRVVEIARLDGGSLENDVNYTVVGPLTDGTLVTGNFPLVHIESMQSDFSYITTGDGDVNHLVRLSVIDDADKNAADLMDSKVLINRVLHNLRMLATTNSEWNNVLGAYNTEIQNVAWPINAELVGNIIVFRGELTFIVRYRWPWRA